MAMRKGDDPADFNADDVRTYLSKADPDEVTRVVEAEKAGKARTTVLGSVDEESRDAHFQTETGHSPAAGGTMGGQPSELPNEELEGLGLRLPEGG